MTVCRLCSCHKQQDKAFIQRFIQTDHRLELLVLAYTLSPNGSSLLVKTFSFHLLLVCSSLRVPSCATPVSYHESQPVSSYLSSLCRPLYQCCVTYSFFNSLPGCSLFFISEKQS